MPKPNRFPLTQLHPADHVLPIGVLCFLTTKILGDQILRTSFLVTEKGTQEFTDCIDLLHFFVSNTALPHTIIIQNLSITSPLILKAAADLGWLDEKRYPHILYRGDLSRCMSLVLEYKVTKVVKKTIPTQKIRKEDRKRIHAEIMNIKEHDPVRYDSLINKAKTLKTCKEVKRQSIVKINLVDQQLIDSRDFNEVAKDGGFRPVYNFNKKKYNQGEPLTIVAAINKCRQEAEGWYSAITSLRQFYLDTWSIRACNTPANYGLCILRTAYFPQCGLPTTSIEAEKFVRRGVYGPIQTVLETYVEEDITQIDVNQMYPFVYRNEYPIGDISFCFPTIEQFIKCNFSGFAELTVKVHSSKSIGPLPFRNASKHLEFPLSGEWTAVFPIPEVKKGIAEGEVTILVVKKVLQFQKTGTPLLNYTEGTERIMCSCTNKFFKSHLKQARTRTWGKLLEHPIVDEVHFGLPSKKQLSDPTVIPLENSGGPVDKSNYKITNSIPIWSKKVTISKGYHLPHIGAMVACYARMFMREAVENLASKGHRILAINNDSITLTGDPPDEIMAENKDGKFKIIAQGNRGIFLSPVIYFIFGGSKDHAVSSIFDVSEKTPEELIKIFTTAMQHPDYMRSRKVQTFIDLPKGVYVTREVSRQLRSVK